MVRADNVTGPVAYHAEGPVWSEVWGGLRLVDMFAGDLITLRDSRVDRLHVGTLAAFHRPRRGGGYLVATDRALEVSDTPDGPSRRFAPDLRLPRGQRFNDGGCSPGVTLYAGSMAQDGSPGGGQLPRVEASGRAEVALDDVGVSNGLTVDADGGVWVALWGCSAVHGYDRQGQLQQVVTVRARQVSACTFGGPELSTLFVTTSRENLPEGDDLQAGSVFAATPGVRGATALPFGG